MKEQTIDSYQPSNYAKAVAASEAKVGKTVFLAAGCLGVLPWQEYGGVVDDPRNLHIVSLDANAAGGIGTFLDACGAPKEAKRANIYNLQEDVRRIASQSDDMNYDFYNLLLQTAKKIEDRCKSGVPVVIISSLTTMAQSLERAIAGPPGDPRKGGLGMDQNKWTEFARQVNELRNVFQHDNWHCIWEAHIYKPPPTGQGGQDKKETIQVSGKAGYQFTNNVEQVFRIRRLFGQTHQGTNVDQMYLDTRPAMDFVPGGRLFTEKLSAKEFDITYAFSKLGLKIGQWGVESESKKSKKKSKK